MHVQCELDKSNYDLSSWNEEVAYKIFKKWVEIHELNVYFISKLSILRNKGAILGEQNAFWD